MTLVEVLVAMAIVFIIFLGMSSAGLVVLDQNIKNSQRDEAVSVAEMELQKVRNTPFTTTSHRRHHAIVTFPADPRIEHELHRLQDGRNSLDPQNNRQVTDQCELDPDREHSRRRSYTHRSSPS